MQFFPALALIASYEEMAGPSQLALKWPNDTYYQGKKVSGTLTEILASPSTPRSLWVLFGIGINVAPAEDRSSPHSSCAFLPHSTDKERLKHLLYNRLRSYIDDMEDPAQPPDRIIEKASREAAARLMWVSQRVEVREKQNPARLLCSGQLLGLNSWGGVSVRRDDGSVFELKSFESLRLAR